jgi:hypothetical protein
MDKVAKIDDYYLSARIALSDYPKHSEEPRRLIRYARTEYRRAAIPIETGNGR